MYADQPTGLGPDEVYMTAMPDTRSHAKDFHHGGLWIDYLERWRKRGGRRLPPGLGEKLPIVPKDGEPVQGLKLKRDYMIRRPDYLLRPEVSVISIALFLGLYMTTSRQSSLCTFFGKPQAIRNGVNVDGKSFKQSKGKPKRLQDMHL